jgi:energy-coupling factor transporter ATP-binding protein EcfA2
MDHTPIRNNTTISIAVALFLAIIVIALGAWWISESGEVILQALNALLVAGVTSSILICAVLVIVFTCRGIAETRMASARAKRVERDAQHTVIIADAGQQVHISDERHDILWRAAHRDPRVYANGQWAEPDKIEIASFLAYLESTQPRALPPATTERLLESPDQVVLLDELNDAERVLIVGGSGSGKTTLLQHIAAKRQGDVIVVDPHDDRRTWPGNCQVVGGGQDYEAIERLLLGLVERVKERYQQRARGEAPEFDWLTLVMDEWRAIVQNTNHCGDSMKTILTGGRKVRMGTVIGSHSERARPLGIDGEADLKDGFILVRLHGDRQRGFSATLDRGDGQVPVVLPGPYHPQLAETRPTVLDPAQVQLPMGEQERRILELWDAGHRTITKLGAIVYGSKGGQQNELVREVLRRHGRV